MKDFDITHWRSEDQFLQNIPSRKRTLRLAVFLCTFIMAPLTVKNFLNDDIYLALANATCLLVMWLELISVHYRGKSFAHYSIIMGLMIATAVSPIYQVGFYGAIWIFPLIITFFFFAPLKIAMLSCVALIAAATALSILKFEASLYLRLFISWSICALICATIRSNINQLQITLREQSCKDPLTGAFNRRQLDNSLRHSIYQNECHGTSMAIAIIDIDDFKSINDRFGHDVGDRLIQEVVTIIEQHSRKEDQLFRIGGDELLLLLRNISEGQALKLCEKLRQLIAEQSNRAIGATELSVSIGLCRYHSAMNQDLWFKQADQALYKAKSEGRNQVVLSNSTAMEEFAASV